MKKAIIYFSMTGNTQAMAESFLEGMQSVDSEVELFDASSFDVSSVEEYSHLAFGCPSCGEEELDEGEFLPMFEAVLPMLTTKKVFLFGSYSWGDGEFMRSWLELASNNNVNIVNNYITVEYPDDEAKETLKSLGIEFAKA